MLNSQMTPLCETRNTCRTDMKCHKEVEKVAIQKYHNKYVFLT